MKKPDNWYKFSQVNCELFSLGSYDRGISNMSPRSSQLYCKRKDNQGKERPRWKGDVHLELLHCHWNFCPKLKEQRKALKRKNNKSMIAVVADSLAEQIPIKIEEEKIDG